MTSTTGRPTLRRLIKSLQYGFITLAACLVVWFTGITVLRWAAGIVVAITIAMTTLSIRFYVLNSRPYKSARAKTQTSDETILICAAIAFIAGAMIVSWGRIGFWLGWAAIAVSVVVAMGWLMHVGITWNERRKHG